jgi:hypothetical protein
MDGKVSLQGAHESNGSRHSGFQQAIAAMGCDSCQSTANSEIRLCHSTCRVAENTLQCGLRVSLNAERVNHKFHDRIGLFNGLWPVRLLIGVEILHAETQLVVRGPSSAQNDTSASRQAHALILLSSRNGAMARHCTGGCGPDLSLSWAGSR